MWILRPPMPCHIMRFPCASTPPPPPPSCLGNGKAVGHVWCHGLVLFVILFRCFFCKDPIPGQGGVARLGLALAGSHRHASHPLPLSDTALARSMTRYGALAHPVLLGPSVSVVGDLLHVGVARLLEMGGDGLLADEGVQARVAAEYGGRHVGEVAALLEGPA